MPEAAVKFAYPESAAERDRWILAHRPARAIVSEREPYAYFVEEECGADGKVEPVTTIFLSNRECPFRCVMCDLWRNTLTEKVSAASIPDQIDFALQRLGATKTVKLYNSGSFFDPHAIPCEAYKAIADRIRHFDRVIVECHPAFVGEQCVALRDLLIGRLEVAMGLETVHPEVLEKLNKRMTLDQFATAANFLSRNEIDLRAFILVQPPFLTADESVHWAERSLDFAFDCAATAATLIPTRGGNGAMEVLAQSGLFVAPELRKLEEAAAYGITQRRGRVLVDLWDVKHSGECPHCFDERIGRLRKMNLTQSLLPPVQCNICVGRTAVSN